MKKHEKIHLVFCIIAGVMTLASIACCVLLYLHYSSVLKAEWDEFTDLAVVFLSVFLSALGIGASSIGGKRIRGAVKTATVIEMLLCIAAAFLSVIQLMSV